MDLVRNGLPLSFSSDSSLTPWYNVYHNVYRDFAYHVRN